VDRDNPHGSVGGLLVQAYFGREKSIFGHMPILGKKKLFLERTPYVAEKQHVEDGEKVVGRACRQK
jgi:hypothetical protein